MDNMEIDTVDTLNKLKRTREEAGLSDNKKQRQTEHLSDTRTNIEVMSLLNPAIPMKFDWTQVVSAKTSESVKTSVMPFSPIVPINLNKQFEIQEVQFKINKIKTGNSDENPVDLDNKSETNEVKPGNLDKASDDSETKTEKVQPKTLTEKYIRMCHHIAELLLALMVTSISSIGKFFADTWLRGWLSEQTRSNIPHIFHLRVFWGPRMMFNGWDKKTFTKLCWIVVAALALVCFHSNLSQRVCIHRTCYSDTNFNMVTKKVDTVVSMQKQDIPLGASKILQQAYLSLLVSNAVLLFSLRAGGVLITAWALCYGLIFSFFLSELNDKDCSNVELSRILFHMANPPVDPRVNLCSQQ